ncbi:MAG: YfhO family protein [Anaerolineae bacterium]
MLALTLAFFWKIAFTNLILVGLDVFTYFYPYKAYAAEVIRQGRLPLWNPYLFMGVPFLANIQTALFYPLNFSLYWLPVPKMVSYSIVLHVFLAGLFAYFYARRSLGLGRWGAWLAAAVFAFSGFVGAQVEHVNQLSCSVWLPLLFLLFDLARGRPLRNPCDGRRSPDRARFASVWRPSAIRRGWLYVLLAGLVVGLQFTAGHTQSSYITLFALGVYAIFPPLWRRWGRKGLWQELGRGLLIYLLVVVIGLALAAVQLLPTWELSRLSVRGGGLSYREAASFSLKPRLLLLSLLPTFGGEEVFSEYIAYLGIVALVLALVGALFQRRHPARPVLIFLTALGLFLGLGAYNPFYFVLYKLVPGFDLFRAPARWLYLYTFGGAMLAGLGADFLSYPLLAKAKVVGCGAGELWRFVRRRLLIAVGVLAALLVLISPFLDFPTWATLLAWLPLALLAAALLWVGLTGNWKLEIGNWKVFQLPTSNLQYPTSREQGSKEQGIPLETPKLETRNSFCLVVALIVVGELFAASRGLAYNHPTAPEAYSSLRTAPAHLLADEQPTHRFLSISGLTFDPGDLGEIQQIFEDQLSPQAIYDYVVVTKLKEILAPNLPLVYQIPSVDGYDGGVLPLKRYVELQRLFLPEPSPDGRLREQLTEIPSSRLLSLLNVKYVITDKVHDVWVDDVYYDLSHEAVLGFGAASQVQMTELLAELPAFAATSLGLISHLEGAQDLANGVPVALVMVTDELGAVQSCLLRAGIETAEGKYARGAVQHDQARVCHHWRDNPEGNDYLARLEFGESLIPRQISIEYLAPAGRLHLRGLSLVDDRTGTFWPLVVSTEGRFRLVHSGDVKIYENLDNLPRAFAVHRARVLDDEAAIATIKDPTFRPEEEVILASGGHGVARAGGEDEVEILSYEPERIVISANLAEEGYLVLTDAHYPGWRALTDGQETPIYRADLLFRAVYLPAGQHKVEFIYDPLSFKLGAAISLTAMLGLVTGIAALAGRRREDGV